MMNKIKKFVAVAMAAVVVITGSSVMQTQASSKTIGLNINCSKLMKGDSFKLRVEYNETAQKLSGVKWSTDDVKVAKISKDGKVTATGAGITFVHGKYKGKDYKCKVYVLNGCRKNKDHTFKKTSTISTACCIEGGVEWYTCIECGKTKRVETPIDPEQHDDVEYETGKCVDCGKQVCDPYTYVEE